MQDWSSYSLSDFLLFSPRVYERMFVLLNQDLWPAQLLFAIAGFAILFAVARFELRGMQFGLVALALAWMLVAFVFFQGRYEQINWLGRYIMPIAIVQGVLLLATAIAVQRGTRFGWPVSSLAGMVIVLLLCLGLVVYPLLALTSEQGLAGAQMLFATPDPTAVATLGIAALLRSPMRWLLMIVPIAWCIFTGLTLWTLGQADFFVAPLAALLAVSVSIFWRPQDI